MFAVVILGIGFIMIAAIFPVAIQQSQANTQESISAAVVRGAVNYIEQVAAGSDNNLVGTTVTPLFPATGYPVATNNPIGQVFRPNVGAGAGPWAQLRGNMILPEDPRFAFTFLYRRNGSPTGLPSANWDAFAQVIVIAVQARNASIFTQASLNNPGGPAELQPRQVTLTQIANDGGGPGVDLVGVSKSAPDAVVHGAVAEGCFLVIADDNNAGSAQGRGVLNGNIFRIGARRSDLDTATYDAWELAPGFDYTPVTYTDPGPDYILGTPDDGAVSTTPVTLSNVSAFVIGRGYADPAVLPTAATGFEGTAMDIAAYSTWVRVR